MRTIILLILALIMLRIGVEQNLINGTDLTGHEDARQLMTIPSRSKVPWEAVALSANFSFGAATAAKAVPSVTRGSGDHRTVDREPNGPPAEQKPGPGSLSLPPRDAGALLDDTVIGRPFPVSKSVKDPCRIGPCLEVVQLLSKMAKEPRDLAWAADFEARLGEIVMAAHGEFTIRAIECRRSLCAVEVASVHGMFPFETRIESSQLTPQEVLWVGIGDFGFETDSSGNRVTVGLTIFRRSR